MKRIARPSHQSMIKGLDSRAWIDGWTEPGPSFVIKSAGSRQIMQLTQMAWFGVKPLGLLLF